MQKQRMRWTNTLHDKLHRGKINMNSPVGTIQHIVQGETIPQARGWMVCVVGVVGMGVRCASHLRLAALLGALSLAARCQFVVCECMRANRQQLFGLGMNLRRGLGNYPSSLEYVVAKRRPSPRDALSVPTGGLRQSGHCLSNESSNINLKL